MKSAFIVKTGAPDVIQFGELPKPEAGAGQVRVRVKAVSVNPIDTYIRSGAVAMKLPVPFVIGCDLAGTVDACGAGANRFRQGDRVWASNQGLLGRQGTFSEYAVVDEGWLHSTPSKVSDETAAAVSLVGITAHLGLIRLAGLRAGETIFVNGGSGGVGSMVVQMAKAVGATVIATAGSADKAAICRSLGADSVIEYKAGNVGERIREASAKGVNVWWETQRTPDFDLAVAALAPRGRMILMAGREARPCFPVGPFYVKGCTLHGFAMFTYSFEEQRP